MSDFVGDGSHFINIVLYSLRRENLIEKNQDIQTDKENSHIRKARSGILIFERNKHSI